LLAVASFGRPLPASASAAVRYATLRYTTPMSRHVLKDVCVELNKKQNGGNKHKQQQSTKQLLLAGAVVAVSFKFDSCA